MTLLGKPTAPTYEHGAYMIRAQAEKLGLDIEPSKMFVLKIIFLRLIDDC